MAYRNEIAALAASLCLIWLAAPSAAWAQKLDPAASTSAANQKISPPTQIGKPEISGISLEKKPFRLAALKGKIVLVMFWSTDCAVCRDKMSELRENVQGWADKPFEVVLVSVDRSMRDVDSYNSIISKAVPVKQRFTQLWAGQPGYQDNLGGSALTRTQLPLALLIDKEGKEVERYTGRISTDVWDKIADLL